MDESKKFLKQSDVKPRLSFKDGKERIVKLLNDKIDTITDESGKKIEGIKYLVEHDGELKTFFTSSISLISKLSELEPETEVSIKMNRKKGEQGYRSFYEVVSVVAVETEFIPDNEIPVIDETWNGIKEDSEQ